jgi:hypothetical protein
MSWGLDQVHEDPGEVLPRPCHPVFSESAALFGGTGGFVDSEGLNDALLGTVRIPTKHGSYLACEYVRGLGQTGIRGTGHVHQLRQQSRRCSAATNAWCDWRSGKVRCWFRSSERRWPTLS